MTSINLNAVNQSSAKGKLELTPNANIFTVRISAGSDTVLKAGMAVEIDSSATGVLTAVKPLTSTGTIFGFIPLIHKNNALMVGSTHSEFIEVASDNAVMMMEASEAITQGALITYSYSTTKVAVADSGDAVCGIALTSASADGDLVKVLIKAPNVPASVA